MNRVVRTQNQRILAASKQEIQQRYPNFGKQLFDFLERDESTICYAKAWSNPRLAAMRVAPSRSISQQFDVSLEIPLLLATFSGSPPLEPRVLRHLETSHELRNSISADKDIAILVATDPRANEFVRDRKRFAFPILVLDTERLAAGEYQGTDLRTELAKLMRSTNHFDFSNEIREAADFFGRVDEIDSLTSLAIAGQCVGVFGLRRAGKTSLLYRVIASLQERNVKTIYVQLNATPDADGFRESLLRGLANLVLERGLRLPTSALLDDRGNVSEMKVPARKWIFEMNGLLDVLDEHLVILIDEVDLANEDAAEFDESELAERRGLNRALQLLRGLIQLRNDGSDKRLSFIAAGVAASIFTTATRFGRDNQLFGFASARFLAPMSRDEMRDMVRTLGKRSGLKFDGHELFNRLFSEYGGHPHLTRQACSQVAERRHGLSLDQVPYRVTDHDLDEVFSLLGEGSPAHAAWQTLASFARWYPEEGKSVHTLLQGGSPPTGDMLHALHFGLCEEGPDIRINALRRQGLP